MNIKIKQHDVKDCGAACLASVAAYFKLGVPIARIRQYASTDVQGTTILGMVEAADKLGFSAKGVKGDIEALDFISLPAIAHVITKNNNEELQHFVIIYRVKKDKVVLMDPAFGTIEKYSKEEFLKIWSKILIILQPNEEFRPENLRSPIILKFISLLLPHKTILFQALIGALIYTLLGLSTSIYVEKITDYVLVGGNIKLLNLLSIIMIIILVLQVFISSFKSVLVLRTGQLIDARLILGYYKHLLKLPQKFFDTMLIGEIVSRMNDAVKIRTFINDVAINVIVNIFIIVFSFALMFIYYWKLALVMLIVIPFYFLIYFLINNWNKKIERKLMENSAELESQLIESLTSIKTIKQFGVEEYANNKTENRFIKLLYKIYSSALNSIFSNNSSEFISRLFVIILMWVGAGYVISNQITPGELMSFYALVGYFTSPITQLVGTNKSMQNALIAADRLFEIMDLEQEESTNKIELKRNMVGNIIFDNVTFAYGGHREIFKNLTLMFRKGKISAIIGESGSGKSTLISLLQNLYPIKSGKISLGDYDVTYISNSSLRKLVASVPQQINLFSGNIIENIAIGEEEPDINKIIELSKELGIINFVEKLQRGFSTPLGENGAILSGGQKQKIAIARALYKNPEIIILDEATSSLDTLSERSISETIQSLKNRGKTIIIIAHRLSTIYNADDIFVLDDGRVIEKGNHRELLSLKGKYFDLWNKQNLE